jgi:hypothetical protein
MAKISTRNITRQNIADILETAGYGIYDFAREARVHFDLSYTFIEKSEASGEPDKVHTITAAQVRKAVVDFAEADYISFAQAFEDWTRRDGIDTGEIDSIAASAVVQQAAFGKVVYG